MKNLSVLICAVCFSILAAGCGTFAQTPEQKAADEALVMSSLQNGDYYIVIDRIIPRRFPAKESMEGYTVSIKDNVLKCYLPYIGQANFSYPNEDAIAIDADNVPVNVKVTMNPPRRKCYALLEYSFENRYYSETFYCTVEIYTNGMAYVKVDSQFRDFINFSGHLEKRPEPKEKK